jgi:preprotein translocase subunit SecF
VFRILKDTRLDFMGKQRLALSLSAAAVMLSVAVLLLHGLNMGIEFTGGTELQVQYAERPDLGQIRSRLGAAGVGTPLVTTIGDPGDHEVYIRLASAGAAEAREDPTARVLDALRGLDGAVPAGTIDLNIVDGETLTQLLQGAPGLGSQAAPELAHALIEARRTGRIFRDFAELDAFPGMTAEVRTYLEQRAEIGPLVLRSQSFIGPAVGGELVRKALLAVAGSLVGMLVYIWIRFKFQWGFAAVVALVHDTLITLGLFSIFDQELSLPVIAAFLTLIGYSVNDTVVVFDRIRENLADPRSRALSSTMNQAINQTLSRTLITSGLTWLVVLSLFLFGGQALRPFSFVLTVGIIVGTYSSIFVASPIVEIWQSWSDRRRARAGERPEPAGARKAKKVRRTTTG